MTVRSGFVKPRAEEVLQAIACELQEDKEGCAACPYHRHGDAACLEQLLLDVRDIVEDWQEGKT